MKNLDDKRVWREGLADAEARIEHLETEMALLLEDSIEAKHRIERLETALASVVRALACGDKYRPHQHALCKNEIALYVAHAAAALGVDVDLGLDEEGD